MEHKEAIIQHLESMCSTPCDIEITRVAEHEGALFVTFTFDGEPQAAVYSPQDDILFTPTDWQSGIYPKTPSEIEDFQWMDSAGDEAIVMGGLPRLFTALRDEARKDFGRKVRSAREEKGMYQEELARLAGLKQTNVSRIESGRYSVTLDTITRLSAVLGDLI